MPEPELSIVLSFRNEELILPELIKRLKATLDPLAMPYELIFVNDASTDNSRSFLESQIQQDSAIKLLNLSRRFGVAASMLAGIHHASGAAVIIMDTDLQDPPELIPEMISKWKEGAEVVYTVRRSRPGEHPLKLFLTECAYKILFWGSEIKIPVNAGDFKLLSRKVVEFVKSCPEKEPYLRGLALITGFQQVPVYYDRQPRFAGQSHFPLTGRGPVKMFLSGLTSFSLLPFEILALLGILLIAGSFLAWIFWNGLAAFFTLLGGVQCLGMGILGFYLGRVLKQLQGHPEYVVESSAGFEIPLEK